MKFNTIQELETYFYGDNIAKADAPVTSGTTGVFNPVFGKFVWDMYNQEANCFGLLPKDVWRKSGWRISTARAGTTADGGVSGKRPDRHRAGDGDRPHRYPGERRCNKSV